MSIETTELQLYVQRDAFTAFDYITNLMYIHSVCVQPSPTYETACILLLYGIEIQQHSLTCQHQPHVL